MLFDIGWPELMLIGVIALVVIGPKDLPRAMRIAGYWMRKARSMSREFQNSIDQMIREAELDEMREEMKKVTEFDIEGEFHKTVDPTGELAGSIRPGELPDHFDEAPAAGEHIGAEAEQPELPLFGEAEATGPVAEHADPELPLFGEVRTVEPDAEHAGPPPAGPASAAAADHASASPPSAHDTAPPKP